MERKKIGAAAAREKSKFDFSLLSDEERRALFITFFRIGQIIENMPGFRAYFHLNPTDKSSDLDREIPLWADFPARNPL